MTIFSRNIFLVATFVLAGLAQARGAEPVSLRIAAAPLGVALDAISSATKETWTADRSLLFDVVSVVVTDVNPSQLREKLAIALGGEWKEEKSGWKLVRADSLWNQNARSEFDARRSAYESSVKGAVSKVSAKPIDAEGARALYAEYEGTMEAFRPGGDSSNAMRKLEGLSVQMPGARAVIRILGKMNVADFAGIAPYSRMVFGTQPTLMQRSLSASAWPEIRQFVEESRFYQKAQDEKRDPNNERVFRFGPNQETFNSSVTGAPAQALVIAQRSSFGDNIDVSLVVANEKGETICTGGWTLVPAPPSPAAATVSLSDTSIVEWSADSREFAKAMPATAGADSEGRRMVVVSVTSDGSGPGKARTMTSDGASATDKTKLPESLREKILNPEKVDPLSLYVAEGFAAVAQSAKTNLIAVLPDRLFGAMLPAVRAKTSVTTLAEDIQTKYGMNLSQADGWLIATPRRAAAMRDERADRPALGKMLRKLDQIGLLHLSERADYEATRPYAVGGNPLDNMMVTVINPTYAAERFGFSRGLESETLRFFGRLTPTQRTAILRNGTLSLNELNGAQWEALERMVWHSTIGPSSLTPSDDTPFISTGRGGFALSGPARFDTERTNVLGSGIPKVGSIQAKVKTEKAVMGITPGGGKSVLTTEDLAKNKLASEGGTAMLASAPVAFDKFQAADYQDIELTFLLAKDYGMVRSLSDFTFNPSDTPVPYGALPEDFRKAVEADYQELKAMMDGIRQGGFPGRGNGNGP